MKTSLTGALLARLQSLDDFRMMAVALDAVGLEVVAGLGEQESDLGLAPGAGHAGLAVGDQVLGVDRSGLEQRQEAELHGGRIAPRVADDARAADRLAVHLRAARTPIRRAGPGSVCGMPYHFSNTAGSFRRKSAARSMILTPPAVSSRACGHRHAVRRGEEHDVAFRETGVGGIGEGEIVPAAQAGKHVGDARAGVLARGDRANAGLRVLRRAGATVRLRCSRCRRRCRW